jgi:glycosyltransferase involved in cell wall biosynthesis
VEVRERHSFDWRIWPGLRSLVAARHVDIVHGHDYKTNLLAWLLARRTGVLALATAHGWTGQSWRERRVYYPGDRLVLRRIPRVIAVSSEVRDTLIRSGANPSRVTVLLNGIDPAAFRADSGRRARMREALGFDPGAQVIGAVGRLEAQKRFDLLLEAFAGLRTTWPHARLVVAGDGSLRGALESHAARLGLGRSCRFLGHRADVADLHDAFDLFVQSSEYEGTPNAVLEAMAMETPLVATDVGGTRELAFPGEHALVVPPHDVEALGRAIGAVLADPAAAQARAARARRRVETELSFAGRTRQLERIYEDLLAEHGRSPAPSGARRAVGAQRA